MERGVGTGLRLQAKLRRQHFEVGLLFDAIRKALHADCRRRRRGNGQLLKGSGATSEPRAEMTGKTLALTLGRAPSPPTFTTLHRGRPA